MSHLAKFIEFIVLSPFFGAIGAFCFLFHYILMQWQNGLLWMEMAIASGLGFICGVIVCALRVLSKHFGNVGDAIIGIICALVISVILMWIFHPQILKDELADRGAMLLTVAGVVGAVAGVQWGQFFRDEISKDNDP